MRASARSRLSTRRDETISKRERGGERPACSCHSGVRPRGQTYKPGMCPCARESHRSLGERPKALRGWAVVGGGGERRLTGQMMKWRSTMEARTSQHALTPCCHCLLIEVLACGEACRIGLAIARCFPFGGCKLRSARALHFLIVEPRPRGPETLIRQSVTRFPCVGPWGQLLVGFSVGVPVLDPSS